MLLGSPGASVRAGGGPYFLRADSNGNGVVSIDDAIHTLLHLFQRGATPPCLDAADSNDDGGVDISDPVFTLIYLFVKPEPQPPFPGPAIPGSDPTADALGCERSLEATFVIGAAVIGAAVLGSADAPVAGARVQVGSTFAVTDVDGRFALADPPAGPQTLIIDPPQGVIAIRCEVAVEVIAGTVVDLGPVRLGEHGCAIGPVSIVTGAVLSTDGTPLRGVTVSIAGTGAVATTDALGQFVLGAVPVGLQHLVIDGTIADDSRQYPPIAFPIDVVEGLDSGLRRAIYLPPLDLATSTTLPLDGASRTTEERVIVSSDLFLDGVPGMTVRIPRGTRVIFSEGPPRPITISLVETNRVPMALGGGLGSTLYYTVQPHDVHFEPAVPISYANVEELPPGMVAEMMSFDHPAGRYVSRGLGRVADDGRTVDSLPGGGLTDGGWHAAGWDVEPTSPSGILDNCSGMSAFRDALEVARAERAAARAKLHEMIWLALNQLKPSIRGQIKSAVKVLIKELVALAGSPVLAGAVLIAEAIDKLRGMVEDIFDALDLFLELDRLYHDYEQLSQLAADRMRRAEELGAAVDPQRCLDETRDLLERSRDLLDQADLEEQINAMRDERNQLRDEHGRLLSYREAAEIARAKLEQIRAAQGGGGAIGGRGAGVLTEEEARRLVDEAIVELTGIESDVERMESVIDSVIAALQRRAAADDAWLSAIAAVLRGTSSPVPGVGNGVTEVGEVALVSRVAGVPVLSSGSSGFSDSEGRFRLYGVPGVLVNRTTGERFPLPVSVVADDSALSGLRPDVDDDGMPDDWEVLNGLDPRDPGDALLDPDLDGLSNLDEYASGGNPRSADTDGDGVGDLEQLQAGSSPAALPTSNLLALYTLSPNRGRVGERVRLAGIGFDMDPTANEVRFGAVVADVLSARRSSLEVIVPAGARSGNVTVTVGDRTSNGVRFVVLVEPPPIEGMPLGFVAIPGFAAAVDIHGDVAYVAAGPAGLQVVDVSDRTMPVIVGALDTPGHARDVRVVGELALVAAGSRLHVADISAAGSPTSIRSVGIGGEAEDLAVSGTLVYVAARAAGLAVVDVTSPMAPRVVGATSVPGVARGVAVSGRLAVIAAGEAGLQAVDVSDPTRPRLAGLVETGGDARDVALEGRTAFVAADTGGLVIVDVSRPDAPSIIARLAREIGGTLADVAVPPLSDQRLALGADYGFVNGVPILDVSLPSNPTPRAFLDFSGFRDDDGTGIVADASFVYLTAQRSGDSRLYIGQYRARQDTGGNPPELTITSPAPGTTVIEGEAVSVTVFASDDIAVASVEFEIDGEVRESDRTPPYAMRLVVPAGVTRLELGASAVDFGANVGRAGTIALSVVPDPLTTVRAVVVGEDGTPRGGAEVSVAGVSGVTAADGSVTIVGVPTLERFLVARATLALEDGTCLSVESTAAEAARGGLTDLGVIRLPAVAETIHDLAADWSDEENPNGPWSYNSAPGVPITVHVEDWDPDNAFPAPQPAWPHGHVPAWLRVASTPVSPDFDITVGAVMMHGSESSAAGVSWTSPEDGIIEVSGGAWLVRDRGRSMRWTLSLEGTLLASGDLATGDAYDSRNPFRFADGAPAGEDLTLPVARGDTLVLDLVKTGAFAEYCGVELSVRFLRECP